MIPQWETGVEIDGFGHIARHALASGTRLDPYIVWANLTHYRDLGGMPRGRVPVAIELKRGGVTARQFAEEIDRNGWQEWIWIGALYRHPPLLLEATRFFTAHVTREFFARLGSDLSGRFERVTEALAISSHGDARMHRTRTDRAPLRPIPACKAAARMVVGVCEEGLSFLQRRHAEDSCGTKTRFQCFWNQNDAAHSATGLGYGSELLKGQMDAILSDAFAAGNAPHASGDARIYRFGQATRDDAPHGSSRAPASPMSRDEAPPMIGVQLRRRNRITDDAFGPCPDADLLDAVRYVVQRAHDIGGPASHALLSLNAGHVAWQQDGSSLIESALDELMNLGACSVVLPSGHEDLSHRRGAQTIADQTALHWPVRADCTAPSFAEIWLSGEGAQPDVDIQIVPPDGSTSAWLARGEIGLYARGGEALCTVVHLGRGARGDGHMILVALAPTAPRARSRRAPAGRWLIRLRNNARTAATALIWMQCAESSDDAPLVAPGHCHGDGD
jgi:hypothetical protein